MQVLVVDPDLRVQQSLSEGLRHQWAEVDVVCAATAGGARDLFHAHRADAVVLAAGLPEWPSRDLLCEIRVASDVPVLMLAKMGTDADRIDALKVGADNYLVQPVSAAVLAAHIDAVLRRGRLVRRADDEPDVQAGALAVWFRRREVAIGGEPVHLTPTEYQLLYQLVLHPNEVVGSAALLQRVWGSQYGANTTYLKVFINRLRSKLGRRGAGGYIRTRRGVGYSFVGPSKNPSR